MTRPLRVVLAIVAGCLAVLAPAVALAHPLGNYTVNRAVEATVHVGRVEVRYLIDMAEIPAYSAILGLDTDRDGFRAPDELERFADEVCATTIAAVDVSVDGEAHRLQRSSAPELSFPAGSGGLETLRLVCASSVSLGMAGEHDLSIRDRSQDGPIGWREMTIRGNGVRLIESDVPTMSPSAGLTAYPAEEIGSPLDVREGKARFTTKGTLDSLSAVASVPADRVPPTDPLAGLLQSRATVPVILVALGVAAALGAAHAVTPGHGKTLVAAYLIGSGASTWHAAWLGLSVAVSHTVGVFVVGGVILLAGEVIAPERVLAWLAVGSGILILALGIGLLTRALRAPGRHGHAHPHDHAHLQIGPHIHEVEARARPRQLLALGLAGGMVPSASALIVLLAAVSTGRLAFGMALIVAFGVGMAVVLGGLAMATAWIRNWEGARRWHGIGWLGRLGGVLPIALAFVVLAAGAAILVDAVNRAA